MGNPLSRFASRCDRVHGFSLQQSQARPEYGKPKPAGLKPFKRCPCCKLTCRRTTMIRADNKLLYCAECLSFRGHSQPVGTPGYVSRYTTTESDNAQ